MARRPKQAPASVIDRARAAIVYQARECEQCLRLALFAETEPSLSQGLADGLRKMAAYHSDHAFRWSRHLTTEVTA